MRISDVVIIDTNLYLFQTLAYELLVKKIKGRGGAGSITSSEGEEKKRREKGGGVFSGCK